MLTCALYLLLVLPIVLLACLAGEWLSIKHKVLTGFLAYGLLAGCASSYWWTQSDMPFVANLPAEVLGHRLHGSAVRFIQNHSKPAYYEELSVTELPAPPAGAHSEAADTDGPATQTRPVPVYHIPWLVDLPGVFIPISTVFWGLIGLMLQQSTQGRA